MPDLNHALADLHTAATAFLEAVDGAEKVWTVPRAPGKWSPAQVTEHVARILEESANVAAGTPSKFPTIPALLRPLVRMLMFNRILRKQSFSNMKAIEAFIPASGGATSGEGHRRLDGALARYEQAVRARAAGGQPVVSSMFGAVSPAAFATFQELHIRHHLLQMPRTA
jgi:Protein of unknown function (DUF1569)